MNQPPEDAASRPQPRTPHRAPEPQPLLAGFTDLRLVVVTLALLALLASGVSSASGRPGTDAAPAERRPATPLSTAPAGLGHLGSFDLPTPPRSETRTALSRWLDRLEAGEGPSGELLPAGVVREQRARVLRFYRGRDARPAWIGDGGEVEPEAHELIGALAATRADRLRAGLAVRDASPADRAALDAALTIAFFERADELLHGRVSPREIAETWRTEARELDLVERLETALAEGRVAEALAGLAPRHDGYARLEMAYRRYLDLAASGGWPAVPDGPAVELDEALDAGRYRALVERLRAEGYLTRAAAASRLARLDREGPAAPAPTLDRGLAAALREFQATHGLAADGVLGPATLAALNLSAERRARQIALNLERWHWLPADLGDTHLRINIPAFELEGVRDGRVTLRMPVVVGQREWETPVMSERLERVVVNPYWYVPKSILEQEIGPKLADDPDYLRRQRFEVLENGEPVVRLASLESDDLTGPDVTVRQRPGAGNALGRVKFLFPNEFSVYLHDTPHQAAFADHRRDLSHGCVRVARPLDLAAWVFADSERDRDDVVGWLGGEEPASLELSAPLPGVHLVYFTAFVDDAGRVQFRPDVYGYDAAHAQAWAAAGPLSPPPAPSRAATAG